MLLQRLGYVEFNKEFKGCRYDKFFNLAEFNLLFKG